MGPLSGIRIIEMAGIGPGPFCAMMLADMGAEVIRVDRPGAFDSRGDVLCRNRQHLVLNLKDARARDILLQLIESADGLIEGFRPGVMERLGVGPDVCLARNPRLVFGRMTGWGQTGPLATVAGHDINYISLTGALHAVGVAGQKPVPPLNLVGDFGGGGMLLAYGMVCALLQTQRSGRGQVIDAAMTDGSALLMAMFSSDLASGQYRCERGSNMLDGGAHFYDTYETQDGRYVSIGSIEPQFYALLLEKTGADPQTFAPQMEREQWPALKEKLAALIKTRTQAEWCALMEGTDVCFAPILSLEEAPSHPHNQARNTYVEVGGMIQPAPAPRFSATPADIPVPAKAPGADSRSVLLALGLADAQIDTLIDEKVVVQA
jgi:alpha-methylacyl-CoA racemase